jgi:hypothetical protein
MATYPPKIVGTAAATGVTGADLSSDPVTDTITVDGFSRLKLLIQLTRGGAATDVGVSKLEESDDGTTWSIVQRDTAGTLTDYAASHATTVSTNISVILDVSPFVFVRATISGTSATSSDLVTATARVSRAE